MIIPVRCFTCGKVRRACHRRGTRRIAMRSLPSTANSFGVQVIGNKYEQYLKLLQQDYTEGYARSAGIDTGVPMPP